MPALSPSQIVQSIIDALDESDASAILISPSRGHPRRFIVQFGRNVIELWVYVWTLTHGGGVARPQNEYRIQLTGVQPPLALNPNGLTILIGYEPNLPCFAGFDLSKHHTFSRLQINSGVSRSNIPRLDTHTISPFCLFLHPSLNYAFLTFTPQA